jgi:hypothetical protein
MRCATLTRCWASRNRAVERPVDQHVGDVIVFEEGFERSKPDHVVGQLGSECGFLEFIELNALLGRDFTDQLGNFGLEGAARDAAGD